MALSFRVLDLAEEDVGEHGPVESVLPGFTASRLVTGTTPPMIAGTAPDRPGQILWTLSGMSEDAEIQPS